MKTLITLLFAVWLTGCFAHTPPDSDDAPSNGGDSPYGEFRNPFPIAEAQPVVPPPGTTAEAQPAKARSDCGSRCSVLNDLNDECASRTVSCQRMIKALGSAENDTCRDRDKICAKADRALDRVEGCICR